MIKTYQISNFDLAGIASNNGYIDASSLLKGDAFKIGYSCDAKGCCEEFPLYLQINNTDWVKITIPPQTGIYEFQRETYIEYGIENVTNVLVTGIKVPDGVNFVFDYCVEE